MPTTRYQTITWISSASENPPIREKDNTYERTKNVLVKTVQRDRDGFVKKIDFHIGYMIRFDPEDNFVWKIEGPDSYEIRDEVVEWAVLE